MNVSAISVNKALDGIQRLFFDTAPLIYFIEENVTYLERVKAILNLLDAGKFTSFTSVVTLTEILPLPMRTGDAVLIQKHRDFLLHSRNLSLITIDIFIAMQAAELRSKYNLRTADALQIASALDVNCDVFLTNDKQLRRVTELHVLVLDDLEQVT
jgi:predicted nucleic acid-binding protein